MNQEFPLLLFPCVNEDATDVEYVSSMHKNAENLLKLNLNQPIDANYEEDTQVVNCVTHKHYSNSIISPISPLLPWHQPKSCNTGIDPYFDIKSTNREQRYQVCCKKTIASFYSSRFANGTNGRSVYLRDYKIWLTPVDFQHFCGSTQADWKAAITLTSDVNDKKKSLKSLKTLIRKKLLKAHNQRCDCAICLDYDFIKHENVNYLSSFFTGSNQLVHLFPNPNSIGNLSIELSNYKCIRDFEQRSIRSSDDSSTTKLYNINFEKANSSAIKIISPQLINELKNEEFLTNICFNSMKLKTVLSTLEQRDGDNFDGVNLINKIVHGEDFSKRCVHSIASSPHIRGESAILLGPDNEVLLQTLRDNTKFEYQSVLKEIQPNFENQSTWKNILFASHPRNFIYSDYSKLCSIDMRLKAVNVVELFSVNSDSSRKLLNLNEIIERNCILSSNLFAHLVCCTNRLLIIDERYPNRPLLTWKHHLNLKPVHLNAFSLNETSNSVVLCGDLNEIYAYQFNLNENSTPVSYDFPIKLDTLGQDFESYLPDDYDKRFRRHIRERFKQPMLSMSVLQDGEKFALFQLPPNEDLYYQVFQMHGNKKETTDVERSNYESWIDRIKRHVLIRGDTSLEQEMRNLALDENENLLETHLPKKHDACKICNYDGNCNDVASEGVICERCGNDVNFSAIITQDNDTKLHFLNNYSEANNLELVDLKSIHISTDENDFTNMIYSLWKDDDEEEEDGEFEEKASINDNESMKSDNSGGSSSPSKKKSNSEIVIKSISSKRRKYAEKE